MINNFWRHSPISLTCVSWWCLFFDPHLTKHQSNIGVRLKTSNRIISPDYYCVKRKVPRKKCRSWSSRRRFVTKAHSEETFDPLPIPSVQGWAAPCQLYVTHSCVPFSRWTDEGKMSHIGASYPNCTAYFLTPCMYEGRWLPSHLVFVLAFFPNMNLNNILKAAESCF